MSISNIPSVGTANTAAVQSTQTSATKKLADDFIALAQALNSSGGSNAKDAFANLLQDLMSQTGATQKQHHHHHHHGGGTQQVAGAGAATATAATSATPSVGGRINTTA